MEKIKSFALFESEDVRNFVIKFTNTHFYIADNTIEAFVRRLEKIDQDMVYDKTRNGKEKDGRIIYVRSAVLTHEVIKQLMLSFTQNYDYLTMSVIIAAKNY